MTKLYNTRGMTRTRQALRNNMPKAEVILWTHLKGKQFSDLKFRRQYSIGQYTVDFYCPKIRVAIEVDGPSHLSETQKKKDIERQEYIESQGIQVIRYLNTDIYENMEGVFEDLAMRIEKIMNG